MTVQKKSLVCLALGASIISVAACSYNHPNAMPSGYTYHHEDYKSATPPSSKKVTVEQRKYMDATQAEQFRDGVYDLLERLTMRAGMPPKPVYIVAPDPMTTFYANIDNDLRESMRHIGYAISDTPDGAYIFTYEALPIEAIEGQDASFGENNVHLTLRIFSELSENARQLAEESGQYFIQGAESLKIASSRYHALPSKAKIAKEQMREQEIVVAPEYVVPASAPVIEPVVSRVQSAPRVSVPLVVSQPIERVLNTPVFSAPARDVKIDSISKFSKISKKPSRDDIVIMNHQDKPSMGGRVNPRAPLPESEDALQQAIPTAKAVVRGRVSLPADY